MNYIHFTNFYIMSVKYLLQYVTDCKPVVASSGLTFQHPNSSQNVLRARRGVIRMLIVVVLTFALCNLPFHARKMWQYWSTGYVQTHFNVS